MAVAGWTGEEGGEVRASISGSISIRNSWDGAAAAAATATAAAVDACEAAAARTEPLAMGSDAAAFEVDEVAGYGMLRIVGLQSCGRAAGVVVVVGGREVGRVWRQAAGWSNHYDHSIQFA
jgi:hypothetical protein